MIESFNIFLALLGGFTCLFGIVSNFVKSQLYLSEAMIATTFGILIGPVVSGLVDIRSWFLVGSSNNATVRSDSSEPLAPDLDQLEVFLYELTKLICAIQVMTASVYLPRNYMVQEWKSIFILTFPMTIATWGIVGLICYLFLHISISEALIIGSCVATTDPVLANSVMAGRFADRYIPQHLRYALSTESSINDVTAGPALYLVIYLVTQPSIPKALGTWFWKAWLFNIFMAIIVGLCIGIAFRHAFLAAEKAEWIDKTSLLASSVALSLFITGLFSFIQSDDSLCCFMCGYAFTWHPRFRKAAYKERFQEVIEMIINFSFFVILGNVLPWDRWMEIGYGTLVLLSIAVLLFKRLPMMMLLKPWTPVLKTNLEAVFAGWFGPVGVGAISFALLGKAELAGTSLMVNHVWPVATFLVFFSIFVHSITVPLFNMSLRNRIMYSDEEVSDSITAQESNSDTSSATL